MTGIELFAEHVARFNNGVRSGEFEPMLEQFADDAVLEFEGVPVGPFQGLDSIRAAYRAQPPDDEIDVAGPFQTGDTVVAAYSWRRDGGRRAGEMRLTIDGSRITRLVVTFDAPPG
jgi:steroid Delta-isomerase